MTYIKINQFKKIIDADKDAATIKWNDKKQKIYFTKVKLQYGYRTYFICPSCGSDCNVLYLDNIFKCRKCCPKNLYTGIQNTTKGGYEYLQYKMERFAHKVGIGQFEYPFDFMKHPCPKQKHKEKWNKNLAILQALENMRSQSIFFKTIWDSKTIQSVESGKNKFLNFPLPYLKDKFYPFNQG